MSTEQERVQNWTSTQGITDDVPQNNELSQQIVSTHESRAGSGQMQFHQVSSSIPTSAQPTICFRISNVPSTWSKAELLETLQISTEPLNFAAGRTYTLSLYPACHGSGQTALLKLTHPSGYLSTIGSNENRIIGIGDLDLVIDRNFYGLTPLNIPEGDIVADIVAVTGLAGHAYGSWRNRTSMRMWLQDFLPKDIKGIRIMTYGYNTELIGLNKSDYRLLDHRRELIDQLRSARSSKEERERPIIFLGHSLGGILILQALTQSKSQNLHRHILNATRALFFFGTPHLGMRTEELEAMVRDMSSSTESQQMKLLHQLREGSEFLESQRDELVDIWSRLKVISYYETMATPTVQRSTDGVYRRNEKLEEIVKKVSAQLYLPNEYRIPVNSNHTDMVKFRAASDTPYRSVVAHIKESIEILVDRDEHPQQNSSTALVTRDPDISSMQERPYGLARGIQDGSIFSGQNYTSGGRVFQGNVNTGGGSFSFG